MVHQAKSRGSKLKLFRQFLKSIKSRVNRSKRSAVTTSVPVFLPSVSDSPHPCPYAYTYFSHQQKPLGPSLGTLRHHRTHLSPSFGGTLKQHRPHLSPSFGTLKQHRPRPAASSVFTESEYEEMTSDFCTLPKKKLKYRIKQRVFEKSLNAILLEARQEIIEESSGSEADDTYVAEAHDNLYEELDLSYNYGDEIYEEIV